MTLSHTIVHTHFLRLNNSTPKRNSDNFIKNIHKNIHSNTIKSKNLKTIQYPSREWINGVCSHTQKYGIALKNELQQEIISFK